MQVPSEAQLLALWEHGLRRHPSTGRCCSAPGRGRRLPGPRLAELPLGARQCGACCGCARRCSARASTRYVDCPRCGERLEPRPRCRTSCSPVPRRAIAVGISSWPGFASACPAAATWRRSPSNRRWTPRPRRIDCSSSAASRPVTCHRDGSWSCWPRSRRALAALDPAADISLALRLRCLRPWLGRRFRYRRSAVGRDRGPGPRASRRGPCLARAYGWTEPEILALWPAARRLSGAGGA